VTVVAGSLSSTNTWRDSLASTASDAEPDAAWDHFVAEVDAASRALAAAHVAQPGQGQSAAEGAGPMASKPSARTRFGVEVHRAVRLA
jgi:hypothetical protein